MARTEEELVARLRRSSYWKWYSAFLRERREILFRQSCTTTEQIWRKEGALQELNLQLDSPELVLEFFRAQREREDAEVAKAREGEAPVAFLEEIKKGDEVTH